MDFRVHSEAEAAGYDKMTTIIEIRCRDAKTISGQANFGKGSPANPLAYDEVAEKFRGCAEFAGWSSGKTDEVIESVRSLEGLGDVRSLMKLLGK